MAGTMEQLVVVRIDEPDHEKQSDWLGDVVRCRHEHQSPIKCRMDKIVIDSNTYLLALHDGTSFKEISIDRPYEMIKINVAALEPIVEFSTVMRHFGQAVLTYYYSGVVDLENLTIDWSNQPQHDGKWIDKFENVEKSTTYLDIDIVSTGIEHKKFYRLCWQHKWTILTNKCLINAIDIPALNESIVIANQDGTIHMFIDPHDGLDEYGARYRLVDLGDEGEGRHEWIDVEAAAVTTTTIKDDNARYLAMIEAAGQRRRGLVEVQAYGRESSGGDGGGRARIYGPKERVDPVSGRSH